MKSKEFGRPGGGARPLRPPKSATELVGKLESNIIWHIFIVIYVLLMPWI